MKKNILNSQDLYELSIDVYKRFVLGEEKQCLLNRLQDVEKLPFKDYNTWTWIEPLIMLKSRLSNDTAFKDFCRKKVISVLNIGNELQKGVKKDVFQRMLRGENLFLDLIENEKLNNEKELIVEAYLKNIMQLVTISEMGGSSIFSIKDSEDLMQKLIIELKPLL
ncbi:DUF6707 family protein, partial [Phocaeicola vulgatus]|uniref:DUF6707 family protein n=1 Tax=Phocaeicola vulgatus TaxID=821 RepID=UPI001F19E15E